MNKIKNYKEKIKDIENDILKFSKNLEVDYNFLINYIEENIENFQEREIKEIYDIIINKTVSLTSYEESNWTYLAGKLLMKKLIDDVEKNRGFAYGDFYKTITALVEKNIYDKRLLKYTKEEIVELEKSMDYSRDMIYDYAGANMLVNRYLVKYQGKIFELPQEIFMVIAMLLAINEKERVKIAKSFYEVLSTKKISLATPILANLRLPKGNLSSCFITAIDDNIESIFYNIDSIAKISKNGGGVGVNISRIRAKNSMVNGYYNASGGVVPWIKIINDTAVAVNQQGRRAGAVTVALDSWHLDIESFLELQTENGDQRGKAYDIYPQVVLSDIFMDRVDKNLNWT